MSWIQIFLLTCLIKANFVLGRITNVDPNATISFFFTADPQFGWGASYSGNEERYEIDLFWAHVLFWAHAIFSALYFERKLSVFKYMIKWTHALLTAR